MNSEDLRFLASRADGISGRAESRLAEVHARIVTARRRRALGAVTGTSAAVVALVVGVVSLTGPTGQKKDDGPVPPLTSETASPTVRKIVYSDDLTSIPHKGDTPLGRVGTIHVGDREVRIDQVLKTVQGWALGVTDAGAVYAKDDHTVWLTDGGEPQKVADQACVDTTQTSGLVTGNVGPLAAWFDCSSASRGVDLVVFDTVAGREVLRHPIPECRGRDPRWPASRCDFRGMVGEHVYVRVLLDDDTGVERELVVDVAADEVVPTRRATFAEDVADHPRGLVMGDDLRTGVRSTGPGQVFRVVGQRLVPELDQDTAQASESTPARATYDTGTGREVRLQLPDGYHARRNDPTDDAPFFFLSGWLDDGTVTLVRGNTGTHLGDILVCHLADGRCQVAVRAPRGDATRIMAGVHLPG